MTDRRATLRKLVIARRDVLANLCDARLDLLDAEAAGLDELNLRARVADLENRDAELAFEQRRLSAEIADAEARAERDPLTPLDAG